MSEIRYKGQIYSGAASFGSADDVSYDNTDSGLAADNVQEAIDELNSNSISDIQQMYVDTVLTAGSDHVSVTAIIPNGYNFLTWTTVSAFGAVLTCDLIWELNNMATIYVSPIPSVDVTISVRYLVYK